MTLKVTRRASFAGRRSSSKSPRMLGSTPRNRNFPKKKRYVPVWSRKPKSSWRRAQRFTQRHNLWGAQAASLLVSAARRNEIFKLFNAATNNLSHRRLQRRRQNHLRQRISPARSEVLALLQRRRNCARPVAARSERRSDQSRSAVVRRSARLNRHETFALESTLSGKTYIRIFERALSSGYDLELHYLWLSNVEQAIARVRRRVRMGGHNVPVKDIRRRFKRSLNHLIDDYLRLATRWAIWDNRGLPAKRLATSATDDVNSVRRLIGV